MFRVLVGANFNSFLRSYIVPHISRNERLCATNVEQSKNNIISYVNELNQTVIVPQSRQDKYKDILLCYGFRSRQVDHIFREVPELLILKTEDLHSCVTNWYSFKVDESIILKGLTMCPKLLTLSKNQITERVKYLMTVFAEKDISKLLKTYPRAFLDKPSDIEEKVRYIIFYMGVEQKSIVKAEALRYDLLHIRMRHTFLAACGKYRKPKKKEVISTNPALSKVFSANMDTFMSISGLTEEEFHAFCDVFGKLEEEDGENALELVEED